MPDEEPWFTDCSKSVGLLIIIAIGFGVGFVVVMLCGLGWAAI